MKKKYFRVVVLIATALCFCTIMILINTINKEETSLTEVDGNIGMENNMAIENKEDDLSYENYAKIEVRQETETFEVATPAPTAEQTGIPTSTACEINNAFATLKITTNKKIGMYTVMPDVDEETLKDNIGWLPSSSFPGEEGVCVFMGHRDTDFKILKYIETGDILTITTSGEIFNYEVKKTDIINSDTNLRFSATYGCSLILITCYPFYYSGHAPQKMVVFAKLIT